MDDGRRPPSEEQPLDLSIIVAVFPIVFIGELPDKTMFASLVLASHGRPLSVWIGAAAAFTIHVAIATTIGVAVFALLPSRAVEALVAVMFLGGAVYAYREGNHDETELVDKEEASHSRVVVTAFLVIFVAEWGDLTQILTANLAAHYHSALNVAVGAVLALWAVAGIAVVSGQGLLRRLPVAVLRRITAVVLLLLAAYSAYTAITG
jgi:putative Ca2+/H+ antiporter (TMEM165/GDT1 family)